jgi:transposase
MALGHPYWVLGFQDEVWWSRLAQPNLHTWTDTKPLRLLQNEPERSDPEPKAVACYGLLRADTQGMLLRFVAGRPVSAVTTQFLAWLTGRLAAEGKTALLLVWDNASWHISQAVRAWLKAHNRCVKREGGCRVVVCRLPTKSPWLNRIEPKWVHGKRAVAEPERKLSVEELEQRICAYYECERLEHIAQKVA